MKEAIAVLLLLFLLKVFGKGTFFKVLLQLVEIKSLLNVYAEIHEKLLESLDLSAAILIVCTATAVLCWALGL